MHPSLLKVHVLSSVRDSVFPPLLTFAQVQPPLRSTFTRDCDLFVEVEQSHRFLVGLSLPLFFPPSLQSSVTSFLFPHSSSMTFSDGNFIFCDFCHPFNFLLDFGLLCAKSCRFPVLSPPFFCYHREGRSLLWLFEGGPYLNHNSPNA